MLSICMVLYQHKLKTMKQKLVDWNFKFNDFFRSFIRLFFMLRKTTKTNIFYLIKE